jgi:hypothetical protein
MLLWCVSEEVRFAASEIMNNGLRPQAMQEYFFVLKRKVCLHNAIVVARSCIHTMYALHFY